jgi:hypothetical protein
MIGAVALMACTAATFAGQPETGSFTDAAGIAAGLAKYAGQVPASLFLHSADRRQHHWRVGGFACICLRGRRPALAQALSHRDATEARGFYLV